MLINFQTKYYRRGYGLRKIGWWPLIISTDLNAKGFELDPNQPIVNVIKNNIVYYHESNLEGLHVEATPLHSPCLGKHVWAFEVDVCLDWWSMIGHHVIWRAAINQIPSI